MKLTKLMLSGDLGYRLLALKIADYELRIRNNELLNVVGCDGKIQLRVGIDRFGAPRRSH